MAAELVGSTTPRLWTRPLVEGKPGPCGCGCAITPETSLGFACIRFAEDFLADINPETGVDPIVLDAWQRWFLIHALEILPTGRFRFRRILLLVARQNGKTTVMKVLTLWLLWTGRVKLAVGTAQDLDVARECWRECAQIVTASDLRDDLAHAPRTGSGQESIEFLNGSRYKIKATTEDAARGIPGVGLLLADELRTHRDYKAWSALSKTTLARPNALIVGMSNAGDDNSLVLNDLRELALAERSKTLGIFEWSAPEHCELDDRSAWVQANPSLGRGRLGEEALEDSLTDPAEVFRTECLCQRVRSLDGAVDGAAWARCADTEGTLDDLRDRVVACIDVAPDGLHVTYSAAALLDDGRVRVEIVAAWDSTELARTKLAETHAKVAPAALAWFPSGPAAALGMEIRALQSKVIEEPIELKGGEVVEVCMSFADFVMSRGVLHGADPLLDSHVYGAQRYWQGDGWRFIRRGSGHVDALYATAGAVHVARKRDDDIRFDVTSQVF